MTDFTGDEQEDVRDGSARSTHEVLPRWPEEGTQYYKVLDFLFKVKGEWVSGRYFIQTMMLSQFHAKIFELENRYGWTIEHSDFKDEHGFKSYRIKV